MEYDPMSPIWLQVVQQIKRKIVTGEMPPGSKMPGGRDLAMQYEINPNTAARVYQYLELEELCETRRGLGTFVTENTGRIAELRNQMAEDALRRFLASLEGLGMTREDAVRMLTKEENNDA